MSNIRTLKDNGSDYPITSNIDGAVYSLISTDCVIADMGDEFTMNYSTSSLVTSFASGSIALIGGNAFWLTGTAQITLPSNSTFYVCLRIDTSKTNGSTGSIECLTENAIKKGNINEGGVRDLPIYKVTTSANGVNSCTDVRQVIGSNSISQLEDDVNDLKAISTGTLSAGATSITINDSKITTNSLLSFYTSIYGVNPLSASVRSGYVTLTFEAQSSAMTVGVKVDGSI